MFRYRGEIVSESRPHLHLMEFVRGYSKKDDGSMYLSANGFDPENVSNRRRFFSTEGHDGMPVIAAGLIHGTAISVVDLKSPVYISETDALVTDKPGILLSLTGADCFPVFFEDPYAGNIGICHAGWRGILGGIVPGTAEALHTLGSDTKHIAVHIGSGICADHFEIGPDVVPFFESYKEAIHHIGTGDDKKILVDLKRIIRRQLTDTGITEDHISDANECTYCLEETYYSFRRDHPDTPQTQVAYIGMRA